VDVILVTEGAATTVWAVSLALGFVVIVVVAILLTLIVRTANQIDDAVSAIWTVGQRVANNTVHIPLLHHTNRAVDGILSNALAINGATELIEAHASDCPG
jgi:predicted PurR-regulated permease PerM